MLGPNDNVQRFDKNQDMHMNSEQCNQSLVFFYHQKLLVFHVKNQCVFMWDKLNKIILSFVFVFVFNVNGEWSLIKIMDLTTVILNDS